MSNIVEFFDKNTGLLEPNQYRYLVNADGVVYDDRFVAHRRDIGWRLVEKRKVPYLESPKRVSPCPNFGRCNCIKDCST
jgi:hypothetical protein